MRFKNYLKLLNFYCFLILIIIFGANLSVNAVHLHLGRSHDGYQKLEKVEDIVGDEAQEILKIHAENNIKKKIGELKEEAEEAGNLEKFTKEILPAIEILTDIGKIPKYIAEIKEINKLDEKIPTFFKNKLNFEMFVDYFNQQYLMIKTDSKKKFSKTMKEKFEVLFREILILFSQKLTAFCRF
uniref:Uncharacterized protein n=1 Tax=Meloidogyne enterolobii TaxID=390850 RepID=A0A6V7WY13_MELEN|nr:unnamed protein product [Meloidogyne enterolobii]